MGTQDLIVKQSFLESITLIFPSKINAIIVKFVDMQELLRVLFQLSSTQIETVRPVGNVQYIWMKCQNTTSKTVLQTSAGTVGKLTTGECAPTQFSPRPNTSSQQLDTGPATGFLKERGASHFQERWVIWRRKLTVSEKTKFMKGC